MGTLIKSLSRYAHPHYVGNLLLSVVFFGLKTISPMCTLLFEDCELELREWELLTFLGCIIVMKNRKQSSYSAYIETACMFAKMLNAILFARQNPVYAVVYVLVCFLHLAFLPEPVYRGPEVVTYFRGPNLENEINRDKRITWLIEFYAAWSPHCSHFAPAFSEMSAKYSLDNLKFGKIDITRYPDVAQKFQVDTSSWSRQLPTLILFQNGKETRRRPVIDSKGQVLAKFIFNTENVIRDFEFNELHMQCKKVLSSSKHRDKKVESVDALSSTVSPSSSADPDPLTTDDVAVDSGKEKTE
jgi:thiol-disulfide isomerase/thioredoxin